MTVVVLSLQWNTTPEKAIVVQKDTALNVKSCGITELHQ